MKTLFIKGLVIYVLFAFGIAWIGLAAAMWGGIANSQVGLQVLLLIVYMGAPGIANVLTRLITREGWKDMLLRPRLRRGWPYYLLCWFAPPLLIALGAMVFFALFPQYYDASLVMVRKSLEGTTIRQSLPQASLWTVLLCQTLVTVLIAPVTNAIPCLGEEFGWRAYLLPRLMPLGGRKALLLTGVIWGAWHWPLIAMGHNYGLSYPGAPWLGMLVMIWFTIVLGTLLGWATLRAGSVWPAVIGHGVLNELSSVVFLFMQGQPNMLLGPAVVGLIGSIGLSTIALVIFLTPGALDTLTPRRVSALKARPAIASPNS